MSKFNHKKIDKKWQNYWEKEGIFKTGEKKGKEKFYCLDMFPYPSGVGLHVGHPEGYTATDIVCRYRRMKYDENILHPMGFDAFGLPTENYAIKIGKKPEEITKDNIKRFTKQLKSFGFSYDWERQVNTSDPKYYKWTQWMFRELYKKGLAYKKEAPVNWCDDCKTVLAREQVVNGKCERCKNEVVQKNLSQWFFKITDYAEELLTDVEKLDWPAPIKALQRNWIGKSVGAEVEFEVKTDDSSVETGSSAEAQDKIRLKVFTTRPDTLFGVTFMVVAPEHKLVSSQLSALSNQKEVLQYIDNAKKKSELERTDLNKDKTGVELKGLKAINPVNGKEIPIFIADYVMLSYGTGAIMAVPAHDERDFEFAKKYDLPVIEVVRPENNQESRINNYELSKCFEGEGVAINSGEFDGLKTAEFKEKIIKWLEKNKLGKKAINYKLRDWLISRQRYWGAPIPIIYCKKCGEVLDENFVELPDDVDFRPTGESPLVNSKKFHDIKCPKCGATKGVRREVDTMDTFVCSSWYFLRYCDNKNDQAPFAKEKVDQWMPVDLYVGGAEHAVMHLMYARFFTKVLADMGYLNFREPFTKLRNQGMILAEDGKKMSKSLGNVINPDEVVAEYGADTFRMYEMFMGPLEDSKPWNTSSIAGVRRFLERVWKLQSRIMNNELRIKNNNLDKLVNQTIKKVSEDIESMKFNTAISQMMILVNNLEKEKEISIDIFEKFIILLSPFAPHIAEELWEKLGHKESIINEKWPEYDKNLIKDDEVEIVVQINGKVRDKIKLPVAISEEDIKIKVLELENVKKWMNSKKYKKIIYIKGKLVSIVV